jgi:hypothetical protein
MSADLWILPSLAEQARVTIKRKRGRIAGFAKSRVPVDVLLCGTNRPRRKFGNRRNGWRFPPVHIYTDLRLPMVHEWLVRVGDQCAIRTLQKFEVREPKYTPLKPGEFQRGPALFYNRWQLQEQPLPFAELPPDWNLAPPPKNRGAQPPSPAGVYLGDWQ